MAQLILMHSPTFQSSPITERSDVRAVDHKSMCNRYLLHMLHMIFTTSQSLMIPPSQRLWAAALWHHTYLYIVVIMIITIISYTLSSKDPQG